MSLRKSHSLENSSFVAPQFDSAVEGHNSFGLDISNPDYIVFASENIIIEVIGGIHDVILSSLRVSLKVYKVGTVSPLEIYRSSLIDLFNDHQVDYVIGKVCERLKIESLRFKNILFDCIERLDQFRRHRESYTVPMVSIPTHYQDTAMMLLKGEHLIEALVQLLQEAGLSDTRLGLQLFVASVSRITKRPLHCIVNAPRLVAHQLVSEFKVVLPKEEVHEVTTMSKHALSYPPTPDFWNHKTLLLHQLDSIQEKGNTLLEYVLQGQSKRLVTQSNEKTGNYQSRKKDVTTTMQVLSYMNNDYHPVLASRYCLHIPVDNTNGVQEKLYEREVKELSGLWDYEATTKASEVLQQIARLLKPYAVYNPIVEQVNIADFFGNDVRAMSQYLQLVNCITLLHQFQLDVKLTKTKTFIDVKPAFMILALELYQELWLKKDDELYFNVRGTFIAIKNGLRKQFPKEYITQTFTLKDIRKTIGKSPVTVQRHLHTLELYGKIERCGGNNRIGYQYKVVEWHDAHDKREAYQQVLEQLKALET